MASQEGQHIRLLAFNGDILSVQLACSLSGETESCSGSELRFKRMSFGPEARDFVVQNESVVLINKRSKSGFGLVACAPAVDTKIGQELPCILLKQHKKKAKCFKYILLTLSSSDSLESRLEFKLPYEMKDNVTFACGPTVLWSHKNSIFYTSVEASEVQQVPVQLSSLIFIGELPIGKRNITIFGAQKSTKKEFDKQPEVTWPHQSVGYFLEDGELFDGASILPHAYSPVVKCICFVSAEREGIGFKSSLVVATSKNQLVWFEDGVPKDVCELPFEEPETVQLVNAGWGACLFIVSFQKGNVCAVWKNSFQVAHCWEAVSSLYVDDFVGCGTGQVLLLFEKHSPPGGALANFVITNLGDLTYSAGQDESDSPAAVDTLQENYLRTIQALESRLQAGVTSLRDLQRELEVKDRVLMQSVQALVDAVSGREHAVSRADQEGLVSLWDEDEEEEGSVETPTASVARAIPVEKIWQRVVEDRLVVGVVLTEGTASSAKSLSVSLLPEEDGGLGARCLETHSRKFRLPRPSAPDGVVPPYPEPAAKRMRQDCSGRAERLTVTTVTDLAPLLASGSIKCAVVLHNELKEQATSPMLCGHISLDIQDVAQGKYSPHLVTNCKLTTEESSEDLVGLLAASESCSFFVRSPDRTLCDMCQWLLGPAHCESVAVSPGFFLSAAEGPTLLCWQEKPPFWGQLSVHYRSRSKLLQILDSLCRFLPLSCEIRPSRGRGVEDLVLALASSLEAEVLTMRDGVSSLLCGAGTEVQGRVQELSPLQPADNLQARWAEMERDRERRRRVRSPLVTVKQYRQLTVAVSQFGLEGDVIAQSLAEVLSHLMCE